MNSTSWLLSSWFILLVVVWSLIWKGIALWKAARNNSMPWYVVMLILNTIGILEILYIFVFSGMGKSDGSKKEKTV